MEILIGLACAVASFICGYRYRAQIEIEYVCKNFEEQIEVRAQELVQELTEGVEEDSEEER